MAAMASLGSSSSRQLGCSFLPPRKNAASFSSRHASCTSSPSSSVPVVEGRLFSEHRQRLVVLKNGAISAKKGAVCTALAISREARDGVAAVECPQLATSFAATVKENRCIHHVCRCQRTDHETDQGQAGTHNVKETWAVQVAIAALQFYKREISPVLPGSCRYIPTCSEYSMQAYRTYGVWKGTVLTAWRLSRCNPLGGSGFDPPRWFGEERPSL